MKKLFLMALAVATITACENYDLEPTPQRQVTFTLNGDWQLSEEAFSTRAAVAGQFHTVVPHVFHLLRGGQTVVYGNHRHNHWAHLIKLHGFL